MNKTLTSAVSSSSRAIAPGVSLALVLSFGWVHAARSEAQTPPVTRQVRDLPWQLYCDPNRGRDARWIHEADQYIVPHDGSRLEPKADEFFIQARGSFSIPAPDAAGRTIRIMLQDSSPKHFRLIFRSAGKRYIMQTEPEQQHFLTVSRLTGAATTDHSRRRARRITDDGGRYRTYSHGLMDVRYKDGALMLAHGPLVLLSFPLEEPPSEVIMELDGRIRLFQVLHLPGFQPLPDPCAVPPLTAGVAPDVNWALDGHYRGREEKDPFRFVEHADGSVELVSNGVREDWRKAETDIVTGEPMAITLKVEAMTPGSGLTLVLPDGHTTHLYMNRHDDLNVICRSMEDRRELAACARMGYVYDAPFWCRMVAGLDFLDVDLSQDGRTWSSFLRMGRGDSQQRAPHRLGLVMRKAGGNAPQRIRIGDVRLHHFTPPLRQAVDPALAARLPPLHEDSAKIPGSIDWPARLRAMLAKAPEGADTSGWRLACFAAVATGRTTSAARRKALQLFLEEMAESEAPAGQVLTALRSVTPFLRPEKWTGHWHGTDYAEAMGRLADRMLTRGEMSAVPDWLDAWYALDVNVIRHHYSDQAREAPPLIRAYLHYLCHEGRWDALRYRSMQYVFMSRPGRENLLPSWMIAQAVGRLGMPAAQASGEIQRWVSPLRVWTDREAGNLVGDVLTATQAGELRRACRLLAQNGPTRGLCAAPGDEALYRPAHLLLKDVITSTDGLQEALVDQFASVALIRLNGALERGRTDVVNDIIYRFPGTKAARRASISVGDRDLARGHFSQAVSRYGALLPGATGAEQTLIQGKLNLALALSGSKPVTPVTQSVHLTEKTIEAGDFNGLVEDLWKQHADNQGGGQAAGTVGNRLEAPSKDVSLRYATELPFYPSVPMGWVRAGNYLVLQQGGLVSVVDQRGGTVVRSHGKMHRPSSGDVFRPVADGERLVALLREKDRRVLKCYGLATGEERWAYVPEQPVAGDPVRLGGSIFLVTCREDAHLELTQLSISSGEPGYSRLLLRHQAGRHGGTIARTMAVGSTIMICAGGALVACDAGGSIQWIRRLRFLPDKVDHGLSNLPPNRGMLSLGDGRVVICAPGSPCVECVDVRNGKLLWSSLQSSRCGLVAATDKVVVVRSVDGIEAVSAADGTRLWGKHVPEVHRTGFLWAFPGELAEVRLHRAPNADRPENLPRFLRRLSMADGEEIAEHAILQESSRVYNVYGLFPGEQGILVVTGDYDKQRHNKPAARLSVIDLR